MKRLIFSLLTALLSIAVSSTNPGFTFVSPDFYSMSVSSGQNLMLTIDRKHDANGKYQRKALITMNDIDTEKKLWTMDFYPDKEWCTLTPNGVILTNGNKIHLINQRTGKTTATLKLKTLFYHNDIDIIIGYQGSMAKKLLAFKISTGEKLWETKIKKTPQPRWEYLDQTDSTLLVTMFPKIISINLNDGQIKELRLKTEISDNKGTAAQIGAGIALGLLTGGIFATEMKLTDVNSAPIKERGRYYVSDRDYIRCIDTALNEIWKYRLPEKTGAHARLFIDGDTLCMLNEGYAFSSFNRKRRSTGKKFFARFNKNTGENINISYLPEKHDESIWDKDLSPTSGRLYLYDLQSNSYHLLTNRSDSFMLWHNKGNHYDVSRVNANLDIIETYPYDNLFTIRAETQGYALVSPFNDMTIFHVITSDGKHVETWQADSKYLVLDGDHFYTTKPLLLERHSFPQK